MSQPTPIRITMPMPLPLKHVHAYLVETGAGWVLIDAGFPSQEALAIMREAIEAKAGSLRNLDAVIVSHFHPDHSGLAGWLQRESDAAVYVHARDWGLIEQFATQDPETMRSTFREMLGVPAEMFERMEDSPFARIRERMAGMELPAPEPTLVEGDEILELGGRRFQLIWTPGHTEGHLCVLDLDENVLFSGDHLLARINPNVGLWQSQGTIALHAFEESQRLIERMAPDRALPGHEADVEHPAERAREILAHHQTRRDEVVAALRGGSESALAVTLRLFRDRDDGGMQRFMALAETTAHLEALVAEARVEREEQGADAVYRAI